jgi:hypothetical protein
MSELVGCARPFAVGNGIGKEIGPDVILLLFSLFFVVLTTAGVNGSRNCVLRSWMRKVCLVSTYVNRCGYLFASSTVLSFAMVEGSVSEVLSYRHTAVIRLSLWIYGAS